MRVMEYRYRRKGVRLAGEKGRQGRAAGAPIRPGHVIEYIFLLIEKYRRSARRAR